MLYGVHVCAAKRTGRTLLYGLHQRSASAFPTPQHRSSTLDRISTSPEVDLLRGVRASWGCSPAGAVPKDRQGKALSEQPTQGISEHGSAKHVGTPLVEEKAKSARAGTAVGQPRGIEQIIKAAIDRGASDLHVKAGDVFRARIDGKLVPLTKHRLTPEQTKGIAQHLLPSDEERARIDGLRDYDCSWGMPGVGRFRVNILRQRSSFMIVMRVIPFDVPTFESLKLPAVLAQVATAERGMILVTGVTGSGKSSTMAAIINHINQNQHRHILTLENPIEFLHRDINCSVTQREIGVDTDDFRTGLLAALRQDPDVILIGELRDAETADTAMKAAETGRLLVSTLHTPDTVTTVSRIVSMFPPEEQEIARLRLSEALHAVVSQRLLPRADGRGRAAALEVLLAPGTAREMVRHRGRPPSLQGYIKESREQYGIQTFDQHLIALVSDEVVTYETALAASSNPSHLQLQVRTLRRRSRVVPPTEPTPAADAKSAGFTDDL